MQTSCVYSPPAKGLVSDVHARQDTGRTQRNFRLSALTSISSTSLKSSCHFWVKQAQDIPQQEADGSISQKDAAHHLNNGAKHLY